MSLGNVSVLKNAARLGVRGFEGSNMHCAIVNTPGKLKLPIAAVPSESRLLNESAAPQPKPPRMKPDALLSMMACGSIPSAPSAWRVKLC
jgi:hypothetical protein